MNMALQDNLAQARELLAESLGIDSHIEIAGIDHVGIERDFDGVANRRTGLEDVSKMPVLLNADMRSRLEENPRRASSFRDPPSNRQLDKGGLRS